MRNIFLIVIMSLVGFFFSSVLVARAAAQKPLTSCRIITEDSLGLGETLNVSASNGRFLLAAEEQGKILGQAYNAVTGKKVRQSRFAQSAPLVPTPAGDNRVDMLLSTNFGYLMSGWNYTDAGWKLGLVRLDKNGRYLGVYRSKTDLSLPGFPAGTWVGKQGYLASQQCNTFNNSISYTVSTVGTAQGDYPKPFGSFQIPESQCGQVLGVARLGKATGVLVQRFTSNKSAYLTLAIRTSTVDSWQTYDIAGPLANMSRQNYYFIVWNFFAEADRFTVAWLNTGDNGNYLASVNAQGVTINSLNLSPDITDLQPVPGGYLAATYNFSSRMAGVALYNRSGVSDFNLSVTTTLAARLPLIAWDAKNHSALYGWIDQDHLGKRTVTARVLSCR